PAGRGWLVRELEFQPAPLVSSLRAQDIKEFSLTVWLPKTGYSHANVGAFPAKDQGIVFLSGLGDNIYEWRHTNSAPLPDRVTLQYGYRVMDLGAPGGILLGYLGIPLLLTLWLRRRALTAKTADRAAVWFAYNKWVQYVLMVFTVLWVATFFLPPVKEPFRFLFHHPLRQGRVFWEQVYLFGPMFALVMASAAISHAVQTGLRAETWTRRELMAQAFWSSAAVGVPIACVFIGIASFADKIPRYTCLWAIAAVAGMLYAQRQVARSQKLSTQSLTIGELRDRAFELAAKAGVTLNQVFVLRSGRSLQANAFAMRGIGLGNNVVFTDYLLQTMTRREIDTVLAHELGHLKHRHGGSWIATVVVIFLASMVLTPVVTRTGLMPRAYVPLVVIPAAVALSSLWTNYRSRRWERVADAKAFELTGDAEAQITSLVKLHRLNLMPLHWNRFDEQWMTHPSTRRRIEAAAQRAGMTREQVGEILQRDDTGADRYPVPEDAASQEKVFTTDFKQSNIFLNSWGLLLMLALISTSAFLMAERLGINRWLALAVTMGAGALAHRWANNRLSVRGFDGLREQLRAKLARRGMDPTESGGQFVMFSPNDGPRIYEGFTNWDIGFLLLFQEHLVYLGDQAQFVLCRADIRQLRLGLGAMDPTYPKRVYMDWASEAQGLSGTFNVGPGDGRTLRDKCRAVEPFARQLESWQQGTTAATPMPSRYAELGPPQFGEVTSQPAVGAQREPVLASTIILSVVALVVGLLAGLPYKPLGSAGWWQVLGMNAAYWAVRLPVWWRGKKAIN
ncbi:MAG: M48 family metalloprotease, partial [Verrucomicrobiota bacterium]